MLKVGQIEQTEITGYSSEGFGVCRIEGCAVFVPNAIRGEICRIRVTHVSKNSAHGTIEEILVRSPHRIRRACPAAKLCGGCQLHHMDYAEELRFKAQKVTDALNRLGGLTLETVPITGADGSGEQASGNRRAPCSGAQCAPFQASGNRHQASGDGGSEAAVGADAHIGPFMCCFRECSAGGGVPDAAFAYRNKAQYPIAEINGRPVAGFYKNRTHRVVPVTRCAILPEVFDRVRDTVIRWAREDRVSVYDEETCQGLLRHIYVRKGAVSGQVMVCLAVNGEKLPREQRLVHALRREIPGLASVVLSVNTRNTNVVLGETFRTLWGQDWIEDTLCGFTFRLSPRSFYQVNHDQAQRLYEKAVELADLHGTETVLDLYCGTGTITLALSRRAGRAIGVEVVPEAVADAKENAARNGVANVEFFCADASEAARRFAQSLPPGGKVSPQATDEGTLDDRPAGIDVIVVDPPRKGLAPEVIDAMAQMAPERIVYVSCDPATLARDVKLLAEKGYALRSAHAFDLFPRTFHVETVCLLSKLSEARHHISVQVDMDELDLTAAESKATDEEIQAWVQEKYGFHVTHLNIAKTKRKCGIIERQNYNLPKSENSRSPETPKEKEEAIMDAFLHFKMI